MPGGSDKASGPSTLASAQCADTLWEWLRQTEVLTKGLMTDLGLSQTELLEAFRPPSSPPRQPHLRPPPAHAVHAYSSRRPSQPVEAPQPTLHGHPNLASHPSPQPPSKQLISSSRATVKSLDATSKATN